MLNGIGAPHSDTIHSLLIAFDKAVDNNHRKCKGESYGIYQTGYVVSHRKWLGLAHNQRHSLSRGWVG